MDLKKESSPQEESKDVPEETPVISSPTEDAPILKRRTSQVQAYGDLASLEECESPKKVQKRWNRDKDKLLFHVIRSLEAEGRLSLRELLSMNANLDA